MPSLSVLAQKSEDLITPKEQSLPFLKSKSKSFKYK